MADEKDKVKAYDRHGEKITINRSEIGKLYALGGKLATKAEIADAQLQADYEAQSTAQKALGYAKFAGPAGALANVVGEAVTGKAGVAAPEAEAYREGAKHGATAGIAQATERFARDQIQGKEAGKAYGERLDTLREASPTAYGAGQVAGMVGGALAGSGAGAAGTAAKTAGGRAAMALGETAAKAPGAISALGGVAEQGVARALGGLAERGVLGRAASTAAEIGARSAVEGGAYAGIEHATDILTHDPEQAVEKLFSAEGLASWGKATALGGLYGAAGGAVLGGAGSLAASGVRATGGALSRVMRRGGEAVAEAGSGAVKELAERSAARGATEAVAAGGTTSEKVNAWLSKHANEMAFDALGSTAKKGEKAIEHVEGGRQAVGEYLNRRIIGPSKSLLEAGMSGRADDLYQAIQSDKYGRIAEGLSGSIKATPARVDVTDLAGKAEKIFAAMQTDPTKIAGAKAFYDRVQLEVSALANAGKVAADGTMDAADSFYTRAALERQAYELGKASGSAGDAYKAFLREWDSATVNAIDEAATRAGKSGAADEIRAWKREWQLASAAEKAAKNGLQRVQGNNIIGLRAGVGAAVGLVTGHPLGAVAGAAGMKLLQERGAAVAAKGLLDLAERGSLAKWVQRVDEQIGKASKGLLDRPTKGQPKPADQMPPTKSLAKTALARVAEFKSDPEGFIDRTTRQTESINSHSPEVAAGLVQKSVSAMSFLASKVPRSPDPDPLDPHPAPKLTPGEQSSVGRYWWYAEKPSRFFSEVARGKLTYEGAETAQALMPRAFEQLQQQTAEELTARMAKGERIPFRQRQILGVLLDFAATPSQRPEHARFLQQNTQPLQEPPPSPAPRRNAAPLNQQRSSYDRLEADGPGRR